MELPESIKKELARRFYRGRGYVEDAPRVEKFNMFGYPMSKPLRAEPL
jgi:hypothetical protein